MLPTYLSHLSAVEMNHPRRACPSPATAERLGDLLRLAPVSGAPDLHLPPKQANVVLGFPLSEGKNEE